MSSNVRYLILTPNASGRDGISHLTRSVAAALVDCGSDVEIWSLTEPSGTLEPLDVPVHGARGSRLRAIASSLARASAGCREWTVVVMHAHLAPLSLPLHWRGARVFQMLLGIEVWKPLTALQTMAFRESRRLLCISDHTRERFESVNPGFERAAVCHLGLPDRDRDGDPMDDGFALVVGRMAASERYKGHDALLDVWGDVVSAWPEAKLVVVGGGDDRERLAKRALSLGLDDSVRFTGPVSDVELDGLYRRCSFFVMPSVNEGFGLVFLEAMRASKACVGGVGAAAEIIEDGATGYVLDPDDRGALTRKLVDLFTHPDRRSGMGARGRERFEGRFTSERFGDRLRAALEAG